MNPNILPWERAPLVDAIDPANQGAGTVTTGWVNMEDYANVVSMIMVGATGTDATVDAKIEEAKDSSGTDVQDLSGKSITQITSDNVQAQINVRPDELSDDYTHVRLSVTFATAASDAAATVVGFDARYEPQDQASSVTETVS